jgi:hypothetical protein
MESQTWHVASVICTPVSANYQLQLGFIGMERYTLIQPQGVGTTSSTVDPIVRGFGTRGSGIQGSAVSQFSCRQECSGRYIECMMRVGENNFLNKSKHYVPRGCRSCRAWTPLSSLSDPSILRLVRALVRLGPI